MKRKVLYWTHEKYKKVASIISLFNDKSHIFLVLKWETFSLNMAEDKLVCSNCTAAVQEATAECLD